MSTEQTQTGERPIAPSDAVLDEIASTVKANTFARLTPRRRTFRIGLAGIATGTIALLGVGAAGGAIATNLISSQADAVSMVAACLESRGWDPIVHDDGVSFEGPAEMGAAFAEDSRECNESVGPVPRTLTEDELESVYQSQLEVRECLMDNGVDLPAPPPLDEYTAAGGAWSPYLDLDDSVGVERFAELEAACPQASRW